MHCISIFHLSFPMPQFLLQYCDVEFQALKSFEILTKRLFFKIWKSGIVMSGRTSGDWRRKDFCNIAV